MKRGALLIALLGIALVGCTDQGAAQRALAGAGYRDIAITGWHPIGCSKGDDYATGFTATGPTGVPVTGVVCSGVWKGATIRTD